MMNRFQGLLTIWRRYSKAVGPMCETFDKAYQKIGLRK
jgi:hypothetical protein